MLEVLRSGQLSLGPRVPAFEAAFAARVGARARLRRLVAARPACTWRCARSASSEGDEVVTSPFSFVASANAVVYEARAAGVRRHRPGARSTSTRTRPPPRSVGARRALLPVHIFGYPADMPGARAPRAADRRGRLRGARRGPRRRRARSAARGHPAVFGFYANKQMTTGEGGMVTLGLGRAEGAHRLRAQPGPRARHGLARPRPARLQLPPLRHRLRARARAARAARRHARRARPGGRLVPRGAGAGSSRLALPCADAGGDRPRLVRVRRPAARRRRPRRHRRRAARARRPVQAVPARDPPDVVLPRALRPPRRASSRSASGSPPRRSRCRSSRR